MNEREIIRLGRSILDGALDMIYPPFCLVCEAESPEYVCGDCMEKIILIDPPTCRKCGAPSEAYKCEECREMEYAFDAGVCAGVYEGVLQQAIHRFKYDSLITLADILAAVMINKFRACAFARRPYVIIPIPIHRSQRLMRGFNHAEELAVRLGRATGQKVETKALKKIRKTPHQAQLPQDLRYTNLRNAFKITDESSVIGKRVLLVDDVFTTGSTMNEAATVLRSAGAAAVDVFALARSI